MRPSVWQPVRAAVTGTLLVGMLASLSVAASGQEDTTGNAVTISIPTGQAWTDTGLLLAEGDQVHIAASGTVPMGPIAPQVTPAGIEECTPNDNFVAPLLPCYVLIGRIGESAPFQIGTGATFNVKIPGELFVGVNDDFFPDNQGTWEATIDITRAGARQATVAPEVSTPSVPTPAMTATASDTPAADAVLPVTLMEGSCDQPGEVLATLGNATFPVGAAVGQAKAAPVETLTATVPIPLDALLSTEHVIEVRESVAENAPVVACGDLGTRVRETGDVIVGLREAGDSTYSGIVYFAPDVNDVATTRVVIFVAPGLGDGQP